MYQVFSPVILPSTSFCLSIIFLLFQNITFSQNGPDNPHLLNLQNGPGTEFLSNGYTVNDTTYNVNFYHIDVEIGLWTPYIQGSVSYNLTSLKDGLQSLILDLDAAFTIDSISSPVSGFSFEGNALTLFFDQVYNMGEAVEFTVHYQGVPPSAGGYKGLRYETHNGNEPIIASLSTPYLAHTWWPCKDGTADKADSTFIDITVQDTTLSGHPVVAVSNGLLEDVVSENGKKTYQWRHRYPAVPYYIMVAISNYVLLSDTYDGPDYSFPLDYYVFEDHVPEATVGVAYVPDIMDYFEDIFGPYPFRNEKYGMTQLGYYGGIENQTNSIINNMSEGWTSITVHELAHQWFADMITCEGWNHGWLNEGFASYAEALYDEHASGWLAYTNTIANDEWYDGGTLYRDDVSNPFSGVFVSILYRKGSYVLHMLRGVMGDDLFFESIYNYATYPDFQYTHASTEDFQDICESTSGMDLDYFFEQWIYDEYYPKYSYNYDQNPGGGTYFFLEQTQGAEGWRETFTMPMEVRFTFNDATDTLVQIFNELSVQSYYFPFDKTIIDVQIDPNKWILKEATYDPVFTVGNMDIQSEALSVYPNPNEGSFNIQFPSTAKPMEGLLQIFDASGKVIRSVSVTSHVTSSSTLEVSGLEPGMYFLDLLIGDRRNQQKVLVLD